MNTFMQVKLVIVDSEHVHYENHQATAKVAGGAKI